MSDIKCYKTCRNCINGIFLKNNYWGEPLYSCPQHPHKRHKKINARDCGYFKCKDYEENDILGLCKSCRGKK